MFFNSTVSGLKAVPGAKPTDLFFHPQQPSLFLPADCPLKCKAVYVKTESCFEAAVSWKCSHGLCFLFTRKCADNLIECIRFDRHAEFQKDTKVESTVYDLNRPFNIEVLDWHNVKPVKPTEHFYWTKRSL